ncbi:MAG: LacI family transcriptional regulator [Acetobacteraceae bacterium]|nr:LacI family transcriptional regulator [Acetobacteraceae bacterium]
MRLKDKVAIITGDIGTTAAKQRLDGYLQAHRESGHLPTKSLICEGDYSFESGKAHAQKLLETHADLDGVFASNDLMAMGAITVFENAGKSVPGQIRVLWKAGISLCPSMRQACFWVLLWWAR